MPKNEQVKDCVVCGRPFANRKKWRQRGQWEQVIYCSERCRRAAK
ncbi:DUF2256 domain-containing protein [Mycolicibacterium hodleri]|uniref:DUF2256 domain-containing protein n=1 Tax=Mycolicibacterium hodleri TaxID=49897 RepID=A0A502DYJ1_9MYCO|nr:DUF2256 domain-containing protein [Mycolicibacterium hodleri]TPG29512.1 DUF2256 domain-containing protein [Mycolicibacterium hodleri]